MNESPEVPPPEVLDNLCPSWSTPTFCSLLWFPKKLFSTWSFNWALLAHWLLVGLGQREVLVQDQRLERDTEVFISLIPPPPLLGPPFPMTVSLFRRPWVLAGCPPLQLQLWVLATLSSPLSLGKWWLELPTVDKAKMLHCVLLASLNSVHTLVNSPFTNLSSAALRECAICFLLGCRIEKGWALLFLPPKEGRGNPSIPMLRTLHPNNILHWSSASPRNVVLVQKSVRLVIKEARKV